MKSRKRINKAFQFISSASCYLCILFLFVLIVPILYQGIHLISWDFLTSFPSRFPHRAGIYAAIVGSFYLMFLTLIISLPLGVFTAVYLSEYANRSSKFFLLLRINISNLAGMPSIVYGLLGLSVFVRFLAFDRSLLAGALTLSLLILPIIIIASEAALMAVPNTLRHGAYALGARKWQVVFGQVVPAALPGILTGIILAMSRALGESAPLILVGALNFVAFVPDSLQSPFTVLPVQIFNWATRPQLGFQEISAAAIIILLALLILLNSMAIILRNRYQRYKI